MSGKLVKTAVSIDDGSGIIKALKGKNPKSPIQFDALASDSPHHVGLEIFSDNGQTDDFIMLTTPKGTRFLGSAAKETESGPWRLIGPAKYSHPEFFDLMIDGALSELGGGGPVHLGLTVPGQWRTKKLVDQITERLMGTHTINRQGRKTQKVIVTDVDVLSETGALLYSYLLKPNGQEKDIAYRSFNFVVIDIGEFTTCIDKFQGGSRVGTTDSYTHVSMGKLHDLVVHKVKGKTGKTIKPFEIRDSILYGDGHLTVKGKSLDIRNYYRTAIESMANILADEVSTVVGDANSYDVMLVGGGGSEVIGRALEVMYQRVEIAGQFGTLQGLHNLIIRRVYGGA